MTKMSLSEKLGYRKGDLKNFVKYIADDPKQACKDFIYGKEHERRNLGDLYIQPTGLYRHREWRGLKDTLYYFTCVWCYTYGTMVGDILTSEKPLSFFKGLWRYRWVGQTYIPVLHWYDRGMEGMRGPALRASAWHYRGMTYSTIEQFMRMFARDLRFNDGKETELWKKTVLHNETVSGSVFYPFRDGGLVDIPLEMIPYFVTCHVNSNTVLHYIDAIQSLGLPSDPCPMCQAEAGVGIMDDYPDSAPCFVTSNEACDASVATSIIQDWFLNRPLYAMPQPMQYDDPLVQKRCQAEIEGCWKFVEEQTGVPFSWESFKKYAELQNEQLYFEREKWDVAAHTNSYPINGVAQALYRIYYSQYGWNKTWQLLDGRVRKIMEHCVANQIDTFPKTRHRVIAWSCAPLYYSNWCTWAYNCWGLNTIINMDSLMFDKEIRTDTYEHALEDLSWYNELAPMRAMAVGGHKHIFQLWDYMEQFNCDMVIMYDQLQCKGMQGIKGMFEDEFRERGIHAIWFPHALPDKRTVSRAEIRDCISNYMIDVMHEEPLDPSLLDFDDSLTW